MDNVFKIAIQHLKKWFNTISEQENDGFDEEFIDLSQTKLNKIVKKLNQYDAIDSKKGWKLLQETLGDQQPKQRKVISFSKPFLKYAALFIGILIGGYYILIKNETNADPVVASNFPTAIQLKVNNTHIQQLNEYDEHTIENKYGSEIALKKGKELIYTKIVSTEGNKTETHELTVPYGKKFRVILSDGTKIHCDAGTILRYPATFSNNVPREVFIIGQAYFDVAKRKTQPFIVTTKDMNIKVLGTQFNVSAYPENKSTSTVLVEGSVAIKSVETVLKKPVMLVPGQHATINQKGNNILVKNVNTYDHTSWISNKLIFKRTSFNEILKTLSRKHNVKIINKNETLGKQSFTAKFDQETIEDILNVFKVDTPFTYIIKNNTIIIK